MRRHDLVSAFGYAFAGLAAAWRTGRILRIDAALAVVALAVAAALRLPILGWALVVAAIAAVLAAELFNTAIETVVDLVAPQPHPLAKRAKDVAAAAVLVTSGGALAVGLLVAAWALGWRVL